MAISGETFCGKMKESLDAWLQVLKEEAKQAVAAGTSLDERVAALRAFAEKYEHQRQVFIPTVDGKPVTPMRRVAEYIHGEMITNRGAIELIGIRFARGSYVTYPLAYSKFANLVGPRKVWDHKGPIQNDYGLWSYDAGGKRLYGHDIWSNIHYGYIGREADFSEEELYGGAGIANLKSSWGKSYREYGQMDDPKDVEAIRIGIELWSGPGGGVSADDVVTAVRARADALNTYVCDGFPGGGP